MASAKKHGRERGGHRPHWKAKHAPYRSKDKRSDEKDNFRKPEKAGMVHGNGTNGEKMPRPKPVRTSAADIRWLQSYAGTWYSLLLSENEGASDGGEKVSMLVNSPAEIPTVVNNFREKGKEMLERLNERFESIVSTDTEQYLLRKAIQSGTLADKAAALTLAVQQSPLFNLKNLRALVNMASKKGRKEAQMAIDSVKDLCCNDLLPSDRKLKFFQNQAPFSTEAILQKLKAGKKKSGFKPVAVEATERELVVYYFEDALKTLFAGFAQVRLCMRMRASR
jgi:hypothetical protein